MSQSDIVCFGCSLFIHDPYYLMIMNRFWHLSCLKCSDCKLLLEHESTCYFLHGEILCKNDYVRRYFSNVCTSCLKTIEKNELILRVEHFLFHMKCFTCTACHMILHSGDEFGMKDGQIYCRDHFVEQEMCKSITMLDDSGYLTSPNEKHHEYHEDICTSYFIETNQFNNTKQKRLRTSFKYHQLRFMRSYFTLNQNPDAKELKELSEKTNLPKRVLQVWFQNARAKYRRNNILSKHDKTNMSSNDITNESLL